MRRSHQLATLVVCAALAACAGPSRERASAGETAPAAPAAAAAPAPAPAGDLVADAERALAAGSRDEADALLARALESDPRDVRALLASARRRLAVADPGRALQLADRALAVKESAEGRAVRGRALARQRRFDEAAADLERAVGARPPDLGAWTLLAAVHANRGDRLGAERAFAGAVAAAGREPAVNGAWTELRFGPPDPVQPEESLDRCTRAWAALLDREPAEAAREAAAGLRYAPSFPWCVAVRGEGLWRSGERAAAEDSLRWAMAAFPKEQRLLRADVMGLLAEVLASRGGAALEAAALAREALSVRGERGAVLAALLRACREAGDAGCASDAAARLRRLPHVPQELLAELDRPPR